MLYEVITRHGPGGRLRRPETPEPRAAAVPGTRAALVRVQRLSEAKCEDAQSPRRYTFGHRRLVATRLS